MSVRWYKRHLETFTSTECTMTSIYTFSSPSSFQWDAKVGKKWTHTHTNTHTLSLDLLRHSLETLYSQLVLIKMSVTHTHIHTHIHTHRNESVRALSGVTSLRPPLYSSRVRLYHQIEWGPWTFSASLGRTPGTESPGPCALSSSCASAPPGPLGSCRGSVFCVEVSLTALRIFLPPLLKRLTSQMLVSSDTDWFWPRLMTSYWFHHRHKHMVMLSGPVCQWSGRGSVDSVVWPQSEEAQHASPTPGCRWRRSLLAWPVSGASEHL